jgi:hypothetical protein
MRGGGKEERNSASRRTMKCAKFFRSPPFCPQVMYHYLASNVQLRSDYSRSGSDARAGKIAATEEGPSTSRLRLNRRQEPSCRILTEYSWSHCYYRWRCPVRTCLCGLWSTCRQSARLAHTRTQDVVMVVQQIAFTSPINFHTTDISDSHSENHRSQLGDTLSCAVLPLDLSNPSRPMLE